MRNKTQRQALHTRNLKTTVGPSTKRGYTRERIYQHNQKTYKESRI